VFPIFGSVDIAVVGKAEVLKCLEQPVRGGGTFWTAKTQTADRTRNRIERTLDWAQARGYRAEGVPNPARWKNFLSLLLPAARKVAPVKNMPSLAYAQVPELMAKLALDGSVAAKSLQFAIFTACRPGEVVGAVWDEIDLEEAVWTIPAERMKARREHRVPLTPQMLALLEDLPREPDNRHLFISPTTAGVAVASATVIRALRFHGCTDTTHGFRSSFRGWAAERTNFPREVCEACLAHAVGKVEGAYKRTTFIDKRRRLMESWNRYCTTTPAVEKGNILDMRARSA
jgi:integrase